jgi:hypothetical protein
MLTKTTNTINPNWSKYDQVVASCHLTNYGTIFLDEWGHPIDSEYELETIRKQKPYNTTNEGV